MTHGARKRAIQRALDALDGSVIEDFSDRLRWYLLHERNLHMEYRIGEYLRPCPYCCGPEWIEEMRCPAVSPTWRIRPPLPPCDGSGTLPARRAKGGSHVR